MTRAIIIFFATGAYSGYSPVAPGTAGSVVGLLIIWFGLRPLWSYSPAAVLAVFAIAFIIGCWIAGRAEIIFDEHDSPKIVLDEVLGMAATMFFNPLTPLWLLAGFVMFRIFDIVKPFPAGLIDRKLGGGSGVMLDDLASAIYANIVLQILWRVL
jgi:phosphatidylglycerophosphatase A